MGRVVTNLALEAGPAGDGHAAIFDRLAKSDPGNAVWQRDFAMSFGQLASAIMARLIKLSPDDTEWKQALAWFEGQLKELAP